MKTCSKCSIEYHCYGQRSNFCIDCKRVYDREHYSKKTKVEKEKKQDRQTVLRKEKRKFIYDYLSNHNCECCGESDPVVLEFDHIDRELKTCNVSTMINNSLEKIKEEISKCRVLCANCHRRHTAKQLGWYNFTDQQ